MCALFGFVDYGHKVSVKKLKRLINSFARESEVRGTDAAGIAYVKGKNMQIYKRPKPAHKLRFYFPAGTSAVMGHTRMTTQGNEKFNRNNHPFGGHVPAGDFALCHNGVLYNDNQLAQKYRLPKTKIETDSYIAVQLIEQQGRLDFDSVAKMSETVNGSFVFTILDSDNTLYISRGDNPIYLIHFKQFGLYVYASTEAIMRAVLKSTFLNKQSFEKIRVDCGEIVRINRVGNLDRYRFNFYNGDFNGFNYYGRCAYYDEYDESYLFSLCNMFGISHEDLTLLYEFGYGDEEIEAMLSEPTVMRACLDEARECLEGYF